ncbi:hypothetical protein BV509_20920 [Rhodovulum sulfidophilum]|uniref:MFS transporter n=1 Tax=Rhodovulum visakhapatnamense TaxID=364297 RepID=A0ABS1RGI7_9RHOB|nr:MFS transporter [Rhodovulum visakhapatnamense]MBL3570022.1 MFS transporter [Rhodovulum visakhapatnamense]MBL3578769.1 MFS transporter [Rhodovulum visakhapatnamense]OLS42382.1 hypothetical protein BV509_20920 [Rhodovulum sulfidophilum]
MTGTMDAAAGAGAGGAGGPGAGGGSLKQADRRRVFLGVFAFMTASSVPMSFFYYVFPPLLRERGHSPEVVGAFALVYLPYVLRGLWAFVLERVMRGQAGRYRNATRLLAVLAVLAVLALLPLDPVRHPGAIMGVAFLVFVILASGMTTLDGYILATLDLDGRARVAAWGAAGAAAGGVVVGLGAWLGLAGNGWHTVVLVLAAATLLPSLGIAILPRRPGGAARKDHAAPQAVQRNDLRGFLADPRLRALILLALLAHGSMGLMSGYLPVLQVDAGLKIGEIGLFSAVAANLMGLAGAMAGWVIVTRMGGWGALVAVMVFLSAVFAAASLLHGLFWGRGFAIAITAALMLAGYVYYVPYRALILQACDGPHAVSRAAILSSLDMTVGILGMSVAGLVAVQLGLTVFLGVCAAAALLAAGLALHRAARRGFADIPTTGKLETSK